ncbi:MAG: response regulator transcription factor [Clostridia bacterium]|nr:response regulator transcription factor [Clostridia bacterium]
MISVLVVDDDKFARDGLKVILEQDVDIRVVGCAADGIEAVALCEKLRPDLVLMDLHMEVCDGIEGTKRIKEKFDNIKVLILTVICEEENVLAALNNGADGYTTKEVGHEQLVQLIKSAVSGVKFVHPQVVTKMKDHRDTERAPTNHLKIRITDRERSVMRLLVMGRSNKEIASSLELSEGRVRNIITSLFKKFGKADRTQLAVFAVKNNIV